MVPNPVLPSCVIVAAASAKSENLPLDWIGIAGQHDGFGWREFV